MPRPPSPRFFDKVSFVTNFMLAGCGPERDLIFELNTDAALELALMFVTFDMGDIVQSFFDPKNGRARKPARHGKKRNRIPGLPDINEEIGRKLHPGAVGEAIEKLPGQRYVMRLANVVDRVLIQAYVLELGSDIIFDNLLGLLTLNPEYCEEFPRFRRHASGRVPAGGIFGITNINMDIPDVVTEGFTAGRFGATCWDSSWGCSVNCIVNSDDPVDEVSGWLCLIDSGENIIAQTGLLTLGYGESKPLSLSATLEAGQYAAWVWKTNFGFVNLFGANVVGFGKHKWLDWGLGYNV
jgi:hypothetical protein